MPIKPSQEKPIVSYFSHGCSVFDAEVDVTDTVKRCGARTLSPRNVWYSNMTRKW